MHNAAIQSLIRSRYGAIHGATPTSDYPDYLCVANDDTPKAVLGLRRAESATLFLERYLDAPIEQVLGAWLARPVPRARIVEIGCHASQHCRATIALWREAAETLSDEADVAVAVLTRPLRAMFARLALPLEVIAPASRDAVDDPAAWGRYYDSDPRVCAGSIADCRTALDAALPRGRA